MLKKTILSILAILLLLSIADLRAGELTMHWNLQNETGRILDMQFMPDDDYFVLITATDLQIRSTETGEIVKTYPIGANQIEFTPDSTRIILIRNDVLELRNIEDFSLINSYTLPPDENGLSVGFVEFKVDPIRPNLYAIAKKSGDIGGGKQVIIRRILAFNYETMKVVEDLTPPNYETELCEKLAVSIDGRYLVAVNGWNSYIKVFDLSTNNVIKSFMLSNEWKPETGRDAGHATCLKFSEIDTDKIYISGFFPQYKDDGYHDGLFIYSINKNTIIDSTFGVGKNAVSGRYFVLFDTDNRVMLTNGGQLCILNHQTKLIEFMEDLVEINAPITEKIIYNEKDNYFIGRSVFSIVKINYIPHLIVDDDPKSLNIIYPNPTNGIVNINTNCSNLTQHYEIYDISGNLLITSVAPQQTSDTITIDFSTYPIGTYLIKLYCGKDVYNFKVIKEG
jgi:WD40 repeat protein